MIPLNLCLEMNIIITTNCIDGQNCKKKCYSYCKTGIKCIKIPYSNNGSAVTNTIKCRIAPSEMLRMLSEYDLTTRCIKAIIVVAVISKY